MSTENINRHLKELLAKVEEMEAAAALAEKNLPPKSAAERWELQVSAYELEATRAYEALRISALGGGSDADAAFTLSRLYVEPAGEIISFQIAEAPMREHDDGSQSRMRPAERSAHPIPSALQFLRHPEFRHHILLGAAGTGKSSVLRFLYLDWARKRRAGLPAGAVPILVEVREFLGACEATRDLPSEQRVETILDYLTIGHGRGWRFDKDTLLDALRNDRAMLLVDGLDEAFEEKTRNDLGDWLRGFGREMPDTRIILTSRVIGFREDDWPRFILIHERPVWTIQTLVPFDHDRINLFIDRWFAAEVPGFHTSAVIRDEVRRLVHDLPFLQPLAQVPLTLTMLCAVGQRGIRPDNRISVFAEAAKIFLLQWDNARGLPKEEARIVAKFREYGEVSRLQFFQAVALCMIAGGDVNNSNRISRDALRGILLAQFANLPAQERDWLADGLLRLMCERNFLLTELPGGGYAFFHRSFLEYFTALAWAEQYGNDFYEDPDGNKQPFEVFFGEVIEPRWKDPTWHDTLRFLFGLLRPVPALRCLDLLAKQKPVVVDKDTKNPEPLGLVYAVDFLQEVESSFTQAEAGKKKAGAVWTKLALAEAWKKRVFEYARSDWARVFSDTAADSKRGAARRRALVALAANWLRHEEAVWEFAALLMVKTTWWELDSALGKALAVLAPGRSGIFWLLVDLVLEPYRSGDIDSGCLTAPVADGGARSYVPSIAGTTLPATRLSPLLRLMPFLDKAVRDHVRRGAVSALAANWADEPETKLALLLVLIGVPEAGKAPTKQAVPPDEDAEVRNRAAWDLGRQWKGDADVKAALLRVLIGVPEPGVAPSSQIVPPEWVTNGRFYAVVFLPDGWKGDAEVKAALERVATGTSAEGSPIEKEEFIRNFAKSALDEWPK